MRSRGSLELRRLGKGKEIAEILGKTEGYISRLLSGRVEPSEKLKQEIHEVGGPEPSAWSEMIASQEIRSPAVFDEELVEPTDDEVRSLAASLMRTLKQLEQEVAQETSAYERLRMSEKISSIIVDLGKLTGATIVNERMLVNSPGFKRLAAAMIETLKEWPDALRALGQMLKEYE